MTNKHIIKVLSAAVFIIGLFGTSAVFAGKLDTVKRRGVLHCGVNQGVPGFGFLNPKGEYDGFDVAFCKAVAVAIFNDPKKVKYVSLSAAQRFTAIQSGEIDLLSRNTTWTVSRDGEVGVDFTVTTFYDGQSVLLKKSLGVQRISELADATICAVSGTTTEKNITDYFAKRNLKFRLLTFENSEGVMSALRADRCDAATSDRSQLISRQFAEKDPSRYVVLGETISKEPLGPAVESNDSRWRDVVVWTIYGMIAAEELGITQKNVGTAKKSDDPGIRRLLGVSGALGKGLGLSNAFVANVIEKVGNYAEVFERNLGMGSTFKMSRGLNALWTQGGLMYAPPFR
ncbi:MAG: amino acid ABC transporter substrate-binding protein [Nitrospiria bacterium]